VSRVAGATLALPPCDAALLAAEDFEVADDAAEDWVDGAELLAAVEDPAVVLVELQPATTSAPAASTAVHAERLIDASFQLSIRG